MTKPGFLFRGACLLLAVCLTGCGVHNPITGNKGTDGTEKHPAPGKPGAWLLGMRWIRKHLQLNY